MPPSSSRSTRSWVRSIWAQATTLPATALIICFSAEPFNVLEAAALAEFLDLLEHQRGLIADARILMLARHVLEHSIALRGRKIPMSLLPIAADQLGKRIAGP